MPKQQPTVRTKATKRIPAKPLRLTEQKKPDPFLVGVANASTTLANQEIYAKSLANGRLSQVQRQSLAAGIGKIQGNRHLQRVLARSGNDAQKVIYPESAGASLESSSAQDRPSLVNQAKFASSMTLSQASTPAVFGNWLEDALDLREDEDLWDEWEDYQDAREALTEFVSGTYNEENYQSTTRLGMFDALYVPATNTLQITVKCKFNFVNGSATEFPTAGPEDLQWTDQAAMDSWKAKFISTVSSTWSSGNLAFYCQKDWWESRVARVNIEVHEVDDDEHFALSITKIPTGAFRQSSVSAPDTGIFGGLFGYDPGSGDFDSEDLNEVNKPGGKQIGAVHEAGHMLGLDDEYETGSSEAPSHSDMVQSEFGHGVARGADGRIMSGGMDIQPEHGVTFLAALKKATGMDEWSATQKAPRAIPVNPESRNGPGDFPAPDPDTRPA